MGKHNPNTTEFSKPHISTKGGYDKPTEVVKSQSYDSSGKKVTDSGQHYEKGSVIFELASWFFGGKKWFGVAYLSLLFFIVKI